MPSSTPSEISCIILAAGENARLKDIVAPYNKPLILVNGLPLIRHALNHAEDDWGVHYSDITIVASPLNIYNLTQLSPNGVNWVIQPKPAGPVDAINRALPMCNHPAVLILCADNTFTRADDTPTNLAHMMRVPNTVGVIATRRLPTAEASRFTRLKVERGRARVCTPEEKHEGGVVCWIGPLGLNRDRMRRTIANYGTNIRMETLIESSTSDGCLSAIPMMCTDMGITSEHK